MGRNGKGDMKKSWSSVVFGIIAVFAISFVLSVSGTGAAFAGHMRNHSCARRGCGAGLRAGCTRRQDPRAGVFFGAPRLNMGFVYANRPGVFIAGGWR